MMKNKKNKYSFERREKYMKSRKNKKRSTKRFSIKKQNGGKVLNSGGYGCIFDPPLKCLHSDIKTIDFAGDKDEITKLMLKEYTIREYKEIKKYHDLLKNIPNYSNYFLVNDFSICRPDKLNAEDLSNFNQKCNALTKKNYNKNNINDKLKDLLGINMPHGGITLEEFIYDNNFDIKKMKSLNNKLIQLLEKGIIPMNNHHIYHCDIKDSNILISDDENYVRLIDWGLSSTYNNENEIPSPFDQRPFQYNLPFSCILLTDRFIKSCDSFLEKNPNPEPADIRSFVMNYTLHYIKTKEPKHLIIINNTFEILFKHELINIDHNYSKDIVEFNYTYESIFDYLSKILNKYIKNGKFNVMDYFKQVYIKNVDIWGFVSVYNMFIEFIHNANKSKHYGKNQLRLIENIREAYLLLLHYADEPINVNKLVHILEKNNELFNESLLREFKRRKKIKSIFNFFNNSITKISSISRHSLNKSKSQSSAGRRSNKNTTKKIKIS